MRAARGQRTIFLLGAERMELRVLPAPTVGVGEIRLRIEAATTCGTDVKVYRRGGHPTMLRVPGPFGHEMAGTIEEVGPGVEGWAEGDRVVVANSASCGSCAYCLAEKENLCPSLRYLNGAYGDSLVVPAIFVRRSMHAIPSGLDAAVASLAEPLACVMHGLEIVVPEPSSEVVVFGGGPIGLLFVNVLAVSGHRVVLMDPHPRRLEAGRLMGAAESVLASHESTDLEAIRGAAKDGAGFATAIEATGSPAAWEVALGSVKAGGSVLLFGGCAPGAVVPLDAQRLHYSELTVRGAYHHRPATFARAIAALGSGTLAPEVLLTEEMTLENVEEALRKMIRREALKVVIRPS